MKRYEELADTIAEMIRTGVLAPGDRLASVRKTSAHYQVSPATVFQAYYQLEARGLIRARPRSGYYVTGPGAGGGTGNHVTRPAIATDEPGPQPPLPEPATSRPGPLAATAVDISELVFSILQAAKDPAIVPLGSAFPSPALFPWQRLHRSLARANRELSPWNTVLDLPPGNELLRRQIAQRHLAAGLATAVDDVVITNGALEGLNLCLQAVTRPGDAVAVESPGFYAALQALERLNLKAVEIPVHPRDGIDLAVLADAIPRHSVRACWLMTNFQNPVGAVMPDDKKRELVALLTRHGVPLIEDDVYGELYFGDNCPRPAKAFDTDGLVMYCSSFSKNLAPGYRIGWVLPGRFGERIERMKLMTTLSASVPAQAAIADYLQHGGFDRHLRKLRRSLQQQQAELLQAIATHFPAGTKVTRPSGGYLLWVELPKRIDALALHRLALAQGISIAPGPIFSAQRGYRHFIRLNYGHPWSESLQQAVATVGALAGALA